MNGFDDGKVGVGIASVAESDGRIDPSTLGHRQKQTWGRQEAFLAAYAECGSIRKAAPAAGTNRDTVRLWQKGDVLQFRQRLENAQHQFREMLQDMAIQRVQDQGATANPLLLITLLNAHWPEKYLPAVAPAGDAAKDVMKEWREHTRKVRQAKEVEASPSESVNVA